MSDLEDYEALKKKVDSLATKAEQAKGALTQTLRRLEQEHDCDSLEAAERKLAILKKKKDLLEKKFGDELSAFKDKWGDKLR